MRHRPSQRLLRGPYHLQRRFQREKFLILGYRQSEYLKFSADNGRHSQQVWQQRNVSHASLAPYWKNHLRPQKALSWSDHFQAWSALSVSKQKQPAG